MPISALLVLEVMVTLLMVAWVYFAGRVIWMVVGGTLAAILTSRRTTAQLREEVATLDAEQLRTRLLQDDCLSHNVRAFPEIREFFSRIERRDEVALAAEYSRGKIRRLIANAEEELVGEYGRSEMSGCAYALSIRLQALAAKTRTAVGRAS
jgi:hypothetical protein